MTVFGIESWISQWYSGRNRRKSKFFQQDFATLHSLAENHHPWWNWANHSPSLPPVRDVLARSDILRTVELMIAHCSS